MANVINQWNNKLIPSKPVRKAPATQGGKIKGWTKYRNEPYDIRYHSVVASKYSLATASKKNWLILLINGFKFKKYGWDVTVMESDSYPILKQIFKTKTQAMKFAITFMRSHPNG